MSSPEWLSHTVDGVYLSAIPLHVDFDTSLIVSEPWRGLVEEIQTTTQRGTFRFDGSDLMPPGIGNPEVSDEPALFPAEVQRLFREATLDNYEALALEITQRIEAAWQALEETEGTG